MWFQGRLCLKMFVTEHIFMRFRERHLFSLIASDYLAVKEVKVCYWAQCSVVLSRLTVV